MPGSEQPRLQTERLVLRPFRPDDGEAIARYAADDDYRRYLSPHKPDAAEVVARNVGVDWSVQRSWVITLDDELVGSTFLGINSEDVAAELTCLVSPRCWRKGIGTAAAKAALALGRLRLTARDGRVLEPTDVIIKTGRAGRKSGA